MKILFISRFLPHPQVRDSGGQDVYHYIKSLSEDHHISIISFAEPKLNEAVRSMEDICQKVVLVPYYPNMILARLWRAWWRILLPRVYGRNISVRFIRALRNLINQTSFDIVIVDGMMAFYGFLIPDSNRVLDEIDIYSQVAFDTYQNNTSPVNRLLDWFDWWRTLHFELHIIRHYDGIMVRSNKDLRWIHGKAPQQNVTVVPPWFEGLDILSDIPPKRPDGNNLLFVGAMNHQKNIEAVLYFVHNIFPLIRKEKPDTKFYIVGASPTSIIQRLDQDVGIIVTGEVEDLKPYYQQCAVNIVPLLTGGGIIVKTLNGMAAGRPTVCTTFGHAGSGAKSGRDLLVVSSQPKLFANAVTQLLTDATYWGKLARNGQVFIKKQYNWRIVMKSFNKFLQEVQDET